MNIENYTEKKLYFGVLAVYITVYINRIYVNVRAGLIWLRIGESSFISWNNNEISDLTKDGNFSSVARLQTSQRRLYPSQFVRPHKSPE
jgi:hypothetical protein